MYRFLIRMVEEGHAAEGWEWALVDEAEDGREVCVSAGVYAEAWQALGAVEELREEWAGVVTAPATCHVPAGWAREVDHG